MPLKPRRQLGLAVTEHRLAIAELRCNGHPTCLASGQIAFDDEANLDNPAALAARIRDWLKAHHVKTRDVMIGLPARWTMLKSRTVPPIAGEALTDMLRLSADRSIAIDSRELVIDFLPPDDDAGGQVLIAAAMRRRMDQVLDAVQGAGLRPGMMVPTGLAVAQRHLASGHLLMHDGGAVTWCTLHSGRLTELNHVAGHTDDWLGLLEHHLLMRDTGDELIEPVRAAGFDADDLRRAGEALGISIESIQPLDTSDERDALLEAATSLALTGPGQHQQIDFLHTRLAPPRHTWISRRWRLGAAAAALTLLAVGGPLWFEQQATSELAELQAQVDAMEPNVTAARDVVERVRHVEQWFNERPRMLDSLLALTLTFPENGDIWTTDITWREDLTGIVTGRAISQQAVLELRDRIQRSPEFYNVKLLYMRNGGRDQRELAFSIALRHGPATEAAPQPDSLAAQPDATR